MSDRLLSPEELADRWQVTKAHVYCLTREKLLPDEVVVHLGRYYRFRLEGVEEFERSGGVGTRA
ncbi:MAG: helix-turn-helix domain-containing protein [Solirubrobacterales bacterium]